MKKNLFKIFSVLVVSSLFSCSDVSVNITENENIADIEAEIIVDNESESDMDQDWDIIPDDEPGCTCDTVEGDEDGDGIPNTVEGCKDNDGDGDPNCMDEDSDADGISDKRECLSQPCVDTDEDGIPDYLDWDSDGDHLPDKKEHDLGLDTANPDTDGDGTEDGLEVIIGTDPNDKESRPPDGIYYVYLENNGNDNEEEKLLIDFTISDPKLDIVTMIDVSGSIQNSIEKIKEQVSAVINEDLPTQDEDFFVFGIVEAPYKVVLPVAKEKTVFNNALDDVTEPYGDYEILLESIYQTVVGDGLKSEIGDFQMGMVRDRKEIDFPEKNCEGQVGNIGGVCFRENVDHLMILFTDEEILEYPKETDAKLMDKYLGNVWTQYHIPGHNILETFLSMSLKHIKIIVVNTRFDCDEDGNDCKINNEASANHDYFSEMTGATDLYGNSLSFHTTDRAGNGIREKLADAIEVLTEYTEKDVTLNFEGSFMNSDVYTTDVIKSFRPFQADPAENIEEMDDIFFYKVKPETKLTFELTLQINSYLPGVPWDNISEFTVKLMSGDQVLGIRVVRFYYFIESGPNF